MKLLILAPLALTACISDHRLETLTEAHRAYVCEHTQAVSFAARLAVDNSGSIKDERARAAVIAVAQADLDIVASCG